MAGKFLKYAIEAGLGIKSVVIGYAQLLIDHLRKMIYRNIHVFGDFCQTQLSVQEGLIRMEIVLERLNVQLSIFLLQA